MSIFKKKETAPVTDIEPVAIEEEESLRPELPKSRYILVAILSIIFMAFQLYMALIRPLSSLISGPIHLCLSLAIIILVKPLSDKYNKKFLWIFDIAMIVCLAITALYFIRDLNLLTYRIMMVDPMRSIDLFCAFAMLVVILECVRRTLGLPLFFFILFFIVYAFLGQKITGPFRFSGMTWQQFGEMLLLSVDGILGAPLQTSVNTIFYFLIFGAFFSQCGGGQVLIDLGMKLSDKTVGGPAKAAVVSSGLMGMISGSAVANVTTTGVMTIPLMKKAGYTPEQAGAIEAVASTGGQIMPPIMGVGAFIMAEMIGVSYAKIATSAIIPALAYYGSVLLLVHLIAKKKHLQNINKAEVKYTSAPIVPRLYQLLPVVVVVVMIFMGFSLTRAALYGTALSIIVSFVSEKTRMSIKQLLDCLLDGIRQAANIAIPTAACGIMIGIVVRSGAANKLTKIIASVGDSNVAVALLIAMAGCMLLGMALPTVAAYLIANILFCPTIVAMGIDVLPANMFIFYFGVIAQITPPVCLASFTAAGIAGADSWRTGWTAFSFAFVSFLTPFMFVFAPEILLIGAISATIKTTCVLAVGVFFLAAAIAGYLFMPVDNKGIRIYFFVVAVMTIIPESVSTMVGLILAVVTAVFFFLKASKDKKNKTGAYAA